MKKLVDISKNVISILVMVKEFNLVNLMYLFSKEKVYMQKNIKSGEKLTKNNLIIKGPGGGILPKFIDIILNKKANKLIKKDHPITWNDL